MVETIVPVVHGARTWMLSLALFTAGAVATAAQQAGQATKWVARRRPAGAAA